VLGHSSPSVGIELEADWVAKSRHFTSRFPTAVAPSRASSLIAWLWRTTVTLAEHGPVVADVFSLGLLPDPSSPDWTWRRRKIAPIAVKCIRLVEISGTSRAAMFPNMQHEDVRNDSSVRLISTGEEAFDRGMEGRPRRCGMPGTADQGETQLGGGLLSATSNSRSCIAGRELPRHDGTDQIDVGGQLGNHWPRPRLRKMAAPQALPE